MRSGGDPGAVSMVDGAYKAIGEVSTRTFGRRALEVANASTVVVDGIHESTLPWPAAWCSATAAEGCRR